MREDKLKEFMESDGKQEPSSSGISKPDKRTSTCATNNSKEQNKHSGLCQKSCPTTVRKVNDETDGNSEVTIYTRAVPMVGQLNNDAPENVRYSVVEIEKFLCNMRNGKEVVNRKVSTSSEEMMDTSDECELTEVDNRNFCVVTGKETEVEVSVKPWCSDDPAYAARAMPQWPTKTPEQHADDVICNAECSKAGMYQVPGRSQSITACIDEDYQMIDAHIDDSLRKKIINFEYVDFSRLLSRGRREDGTRLELVPRDGYTYFAPASEKEGITIGSYFKWEQAFRVYSNIITCSFPAKAPELLQYNHTIQTASASYQWENVYSYDKEFRHHISRHPEQSWSIILQQAWTMLLKDHLRSHDNHFFQKGNLPGGKQNKRDREPCCRFNRGRCSFRLSCRVKFFRHSNIKKSNSFY